MSPLKKEIADYMLVALRYIANTQSTVELKKWWFSQREKDMRASLVIVGSTPEHRHLYNAFLARGNALSTKSYIKDVAE